MWVVRMLTKTLAVLTEEHWDILHPNTIQVTIVIKYDLYIMNTVNVYWRFAMCTCKLVADIFALHMYWPNRVRNLWNGVLLYF